MNKHRMGALVAAAAVAGGVLAGAAGVHAAGGAPWQSAGAKSPDAVGTITLVDASGNEVRSGDIGQPLAAYAVGSGGLRSGDTIASLALYTPYAAGSTPANADDWSGTTIARPTAQTGLPAFATGPSVDLTGSTPLAEYLGGFHNTVSDPAYAGVYELRLSTGTPGRAFATAYDVLDIQVSGSTWHLYGEGSTTATDTHTTLSATPAGAKVGEPVTLTATVDQAADGTVQFTAGGTALGTPVHVTVGASSATATITWTPTASGSVPLTADFVPSTAAFSGSSGATTYVVAPASAQVATPTVTPGWPAFRYGTASTVHVTVASTPAATGTVAIVYAGQVIASAPVSAGAADVAVPATALPAGPRSLLARFTSSSASVASRDSAAQTVTVAQAAARVANTTVPKKVKKSKRTAFVFTVTAPGGAVTGTVKVYDGKKVVATAALNGGRATVKLKLKKGKHSLRAAFSGNANVAAATGAAVKVTSK